MDISNFEPDEQIEDEAMVCPYCGAEQLYPDANDNDEDEEQCEFCGKPFYYWRETTVMYTTQRMEATQ